MRRLLAGLALSGAMLTVAAPIALGHECVISNRSDQGNAAAQSSAKWVQLGLADVFGFIHEVVGGPALTPDQIEWAVGEAVSQGLPEAGWTTRSDLTIGGGSANPNLTDGRGLDHLSLVHGEQIVGIYFQALGH
jgi:hypothetical protein